MSASMPDRRRVSLAPVNTLASSGIRSWMRVRAAAASSRISTVKPCAVSAAAARSRRCAGAGSANSAAGIGVVIGASWAGGVMAGFLIGTTTQPNGMSGSGNRSGGGGRRSHMTRHLGRKDAAIVTGCLLLISGCSAGAAQPTVPQKPGAQPMPVRLTSFRGCSEELAALRKAAEASVGPYGLPGPASSANGMAYPPAPGAARAAAGAGDATAPGAAAPAAAAPAAAAPGAAAPAYSGTNDYVAGVDEPDLVKTNGRRIVTVANGVLQVIDAASQTVTGRMDLTANGEGMAYQPVNLLLSGDHALLLTGGSVADGATGSGGFWPPADGSRLLLVDLAGRPSVLSSYTIDGGLIDARQVGSTVRVVITSQPGLNFPAQPGGTSDAQQVATNRAVISHADLGAWLPRYE